jgi:hypothetical protein
VDPDDDDDDDESYNPEDDDPADDDNPADDESVFDYDVDNIPTSGVNVDEGDGENNDNNTENKQPENEEGHNATANEENNIEDIVQEEKPDIAAAEETMDQKYGERSGAHNLRARRPRNYSHLHATLEGTVMTQHSMKKGIEMFGKAGIDVVLAELKQLHDRKVLEPRKATAMTREDKKAALQYLMFLKKQEAMWANKGARMRQRQQTESIHGERRRQLTNGSYRIRYDIMRHRRYRETRRGDSRHTRGIYAG